MISHTTISSQATAEMAVNIWTTGSIETEARGWAHDFIEELIRAANSTLSLPLACPCRIP